jgi:3'(2'), 5'-bisphosphate nucleotidase
VEEKYLEKELHLVKKLVLEAGQMAKRIRKQGYDVIEKSNNEGLVSTADLALSDFLSKNLKQKYPNDLVISEESVVPEDLLEDKRIWFIDPIDGTQDFVNHGREWAIMIALAINGRSVLGVVYQPDENKLYFAIEGHGSYLECGENLQKLQVNSDKNIHNITLIQSRHHYSKKAQQLAEKLGIKKRILQSSLGLKLASIAEGKADIYFNFSGRCHLWDLCAPEIILREAGGIISDKNGSPLSYILKNAQIEIPFTATTNGILQKIITHLL